MLGVVDVVVFRLGVGFTGQPILQHLVDPLDHGRVLVHRQPVERLERAHRLVHLGVAGAAVVRQFPHDHNASTAARAHG